jgi:hypothetical protein
MFTTLGVGNRISFESDKQHAAINLVIHSSTEGENKKNCREIFSKVFCKTPQDTQQSKGKTLTAKVPWKRVWKT